ncbi:MAG: hypothetical protein RR100_26820 [Comamonas sp.]
MARWTHCIRNNSVNKLTEYVKTNDFFAKVTHAAHQRGANRHPASAAALQKIPVLIAAYAGAASVRG